MKFPALTLLSLALSLPAMAQQNRISLGIGTLATNKIESGKSQQPGSGQSTSAYLIPTAGYYRMLNGRVGAGLEVGYGRQRTTSNYENWSYGTPTLIQTTESESSTDDLYVSPGLFTLVTTADKRFRFTPGISLPVSYTIRTDNTSTQRLVNESTGDLQGTNFATSPGIKTFNVGFMLGGSALYRVAGDLYAGIQLGAGIRYHSTRLKGELSEVINEGMPGEVRQSQSVDQRTSGVSFIFQPALAVNYFF